MSDEKQTLPAVVPASPSPEQKNIADEAQKQLSQLRQESNAMLKQLMLEQKAKLNQMVQQLQGPSSALGANNTAAEVNNVAHQQRDVVNTKVPVEDITRLQQGNMGHLDMLIGRINATMKSSLERSDTED
ncbi:hypothetical protein ORJ04_03570 [Rheinheimera baltica]|uniref:Uncharacterized protein n=1 Tax=Rheinheimera baltica TaxID=67576 RepID=A0ABT9HV86_9GAMM|nr:hypothetical protein [Rheinheimera baltica]MDP5135026.1 hypothetical protein [Rheinheimera baltica]